MDKKLPADTYAAARPVDLPFLLLTGLFMAGLLCSLVDAGAFVTVDFGPYQALVGLAILPFPAIFLVTDLLSEVYGRRRALAVATAGFSAAALMVGMQWLMGAFGPAGVHPELLVPDSAGDVVAVSGSAAAYLAAQYLDVLLFHGVRTMTNGRHLWLRLNVSTLISLPVAAVLGAYVAFRGDAAWPPERFVATGREAMFFALPLVLASTLLGYGAVWLLQKWRPRPL